MVNDGGGSVDRDDFTGRPAEVTSLVEGTAVTPHRDRPFRPGHVAVRCRDPEGPAASGAEPDVELVFTGSRRSMPHRAARRRVPVSWRDPQSAQLSSCTSPTTGGGRLSRARHTCLRERAILIGANLSLDARPGGGTMVRLFVPMGAKRT